MGKLNLKVKGHALVNHDPQQPYRWDCMCGAWSKVLSETGKTAAQLRREGHDEHKINVLRKQGKWEEDENA